MRRVATYGCDAWTLKKQAEKRIQAFENKFIRKNSLGKSDDQRAVYKFAGHRRQKCRLLLQHVRARKLRYFGHIMTRPWGNIKGSLMAGLVERTEVAEG